MTWKVEAQGDTLYIRAKTLADAKAKFTKTFGVVPPSLIKWSEVEEADIPIEEEII